MRWTDRLFKCIIIASHLITLVAYSWGGGTAEKTSSLDQHGSSVGKTTEVQGVVSLSPEITETVFALGYGYKLAGRTEYCNYPPEALAVPEVGSILQPNVEAILAISPDLVIASTHCPQFVVNMLESAHIPVFICMGQDSFQGVYDGVIQPVANLLGDPESGRDLVLQMEAERKELMKTVESFPWSPKVYYVVGFGEGGDWTAGGDTFINEMLETAGAINVAGDITGWAYSLEALVIRDPDVIIMPRNLVTKFVNTPVYMDLRAVRDARVFPVNEDTIVRQGPRLIEGLASLVHIMEKVF